ncbi:MAG: phosphoribosyl-ATP diphosphatase [Actinomycetota bacterium]|nr:phosphoribosyl-ATP diphosphatase [Actinomycetota bacterium]
MIIPSIDLVRGRTVQLVGGEAEAIDAGDPIPILDRFSIAGEVAVIDIDAARGEGSNEAVIRGLCRRAPIRVGGGIRDAATALAWLDAGASKVIIGTAATPEMLSELPADRVIVALDSFDGRVVTHGWRTKTADSVLTRVAELRDLVGGFLVTFVELEGRMNGTDLERARDVVVAAGDRRVTIAGGVTTADELAELDRLGADGQVGMALYSGELSLADAITAPLTSERPDGLWPTVIVDESGAALGLAWSSAESLRLAVERRQGIYQSRKRGLWEKGSTSGATQDLLGVAIDCDRDALRFTVRQHGNGFCHMGTRSCWGDDGGISGLSRRLARLAGEPEPGSNTVRLLNDSDLLGAKLREEADELAAASAHGDVVGEAADVIYFALVKAVAAGVDLADIERELNRRALTVKRRPMESKRKYNA